MEFTTGPKVKLISRPSIDVEALGEYLDDVGAHNYKEVMDERQALGELDAGAELILTGGKICYRSWEPGLNPNVTRVRDDTGEYIGNIIKSQHGSVLEHANYSFIFSDVSRVFTHELVRHRHEAISQESLRYVRLDELKFWLPDILEDIRPEVADLLNHMENFQAFAAQHYDLDNMPFADKKIYTSALRRVAPIGLSTSMMWTANLRSLRHIIEMRTSVHAEVEVRIVFDELASVMKAECPDVFADFERQDNGEWISAARKV